MLKVLLLSKDYAMLGTSVDLDQLAKLHQLAYFYLGKHSPNNNLDSAHKVTIVLKVLGFRVSQMLVQLDNTLMQKERNQHLIVLHAKRAIIVLQLLFQHQVVNVLQGITALKGLLQPQQINVKLDITAQLVLQIR